MSKCLAVGVWNWNPCFKMPCWSARVGGRKMREEGIYINIYIFFLICVREGTGLLACRPAISGSCLLCAIRGRLPAFVPSSGATHICGALCVIAHARACSYCFAYPLVSEVVVCSLAEGKTPESPSPVRRWCYPACLFFSRCSDQPLAQFRVFAQDWTRLLSPLCLDETLTIFNHAWFCSIQPLVSLTWIKKLTNIRFLNIQGAEAVFFFIR